MTDLPFPPHTVLPPPPRARRPVKAWIVVAITLGAVALAGGAIVLIATLTAPYSISGSEVGQCLDATDDTGRSYHKVACGTPEAEWKVYGVTRVGEDCIDVPAVSRYLEQSGTAYCLGRADADPATSINGIRVGECVLPDGDDMTKVECGSDADTLTVLLVLQNQPRSLVGTSELNTACIAGGAGDTDAVWAWSLESKTDTGPSRWDRVLCLRGE